MNSSDSSERNRAIARDESRRASIEHQNDCVNSGPICGVWEEINNMKSDISAMKTEHAQERGEAAGILKASARNMTVLVAAISLAGVLANIVINVVKAKHGG